MITATDIANALRAMKVGKSWLAPCPAHNDKTPSLSISNGYTGRPVVRCHAGCPQQQVISALRDLGLWESGMATSGIPIVSPAPMLKTVKPVDYRSFALDTWQQSLSPGGTLVDRYLASRGIDLEKCGLLDGEVIRFHPSCRFAPGNDGRIERPAMIALFRDIHTDEPCAIHRTALDPATGSKAKLPSLNPKQMLGSAKGAVIKLSPDDDVTNGLSIAEGIETALSVLQIGEKPVWACGSAGAIATFPVLSGVEILTIYADNDRSGIGNNAASACEARWLTKRLECEVISPPNVDDDWNDVLRRIA